MEGDRRMCQSVQHFIVSCILQVCLLAIFFTAVTALCCTEGYFFVCFGCVELVCKMYAVVKFLPSDPADCEEVEAVPVGWVSPGKRHCMWPLLKSADAISRAIRNQVPPTSTWNVHKAEVMKICGMACIFEILYGLEN